MHSTKVADLNVFDFRQEIQSSPKKNVPKQNSVQFGLNVYHITYTG